MKYAAYILIFAVVTVGTRIGIHHWLPRFDDGAAWSIGIFLAAMIWPYMASHRRDPKPPVDEKPGRQFQYTSSYDGGVIVGGGAMAASAGLPGLATSSGSSGGGSSGHSSCGHAGDGGGDCGSGGGH